MTAVNKRRKAGLSLIVVGAVIFALAVALALWNMISDRNAGNSAAEIMPLVLEKIDSAETAKVPVTQAVPSAEEYVYEVLDEDDSEMTEVNIDGFGYIGYLSIPVLDLELPVMSEWDYARLKIAPCRYVGSTKTDDLVICGHNYDRHFGRLKNLQAGDLVLFTDMDGVTVSYEVKEVELLEPTQITEMTESGYDLTLFTCTYGGKTRVTVRCTKA